jgi:hypothetical protein
MKISEKNIPFIIFQGIDTLFYAGLENLCLTTNHHS